MGFYLRKSISVGPFRFNLSKSGIGVSAGVKGLRFGTGPRGNYVHMGRGGLYYRATIPSFSPSQPRFQPTNSIDPIIPSGTHAPLEEIESTDISQITDSTSQELLSELNQKRNKTRLWPIAATVSACIFFNAWPNWILFITLVVGLALTYIAFSHDTLTKTVVLFYNFDPEMEEVYGQLHNAAERIAGCAAAWHIEAQGNVHNRKYHAGASSLVRRKTTFIRKAEPPYVKSNIETIAIGVGRQTLHFFPDRVLIYDSNGVGAVGYKDLRINVKPSQFIEDGTPPRDAKVVDRTWKYVNKSGGPDRRFKGNRELPGCQYDEISLSSQTGLNEILQISQCGIAGAFAEAISALARKIPKEKSNFAPAV
ncbi:MAG: DUF4236 domain-containing protein [Betaproteobacteria bacterium]|nr:DUF4236 domain-containing protein [Betaproteobacteria bacterium]